MLLAVAIAAAAMQELEERQQQHQQRRQQVMSDTVRRKWDLMPRPKNSHNNTQYDQQQQGLERQQQQIGVPSSHFATLPGASAFDRLVDRNVKASMHMRQQQLLERQQQWWLARHHELEQQEQQEQRQQQQPDGWLALLAPWRRELWEQARCNCSSSTFDNTVAA
jgi:hypothetical protein